MAVIHVDTSGDLQTTKTTRGNRYFLIFVDAYSKFVEIYCIPNQKASTTADCLWDWVKRFGAPIIIITDKGTEF